MKSILKLLSIIIFFCFGYEKLYAVTGDGGELFAFLKNGIGAEDAGIGRAASSVFGISSNFIYNPAVSSNSESISLTLNLSQPYNKIKDLSYHSIIIGIPANIYKFNLLIASLNLDNIREAVEGNPSVDDLLTGNFFSHSDMIAALNISRKFKSGLYSGINLKYLREKIYGFSDSLLAADFGIIYDNRFFDCGLSFGNILSSDFQLYQKIEKSELFAIAGFSTEFIKQLLVSLDIKFQSGKTIKNFIGLKFKWNPNVSVLSGYNNENELFTAGLELLLKSYKFNYTFSYHKELDIGHRLSLNLFFNKKKIKKNNKTVVTPAKPAVNNMTLNKPVINKIPLKNNITNDTPIKEIKNVIAIKSLENKEMPIQEVKEKKSICEINKSLERNAELYLKIGLYDAALKIYNDFLEIANNNTNYIYNAAFCYFKLSNIKESRKKLSELLKIEPDNHEAKILLEQCKAMDNE